MPKFTEIDIRAGATGQSYERGASRTCARSIRAAGAAATTNPGTTRAAWSIRVKCLGLIKSWP